MVGRLDWRQGGQEAAVAASERMLMAWIRVVVRMEGCGLSLGTQSLARDWILW